MEDKISHIYGLIAKKHNLPDFSKLDDYFEVSKLESFSDRALRDIRNTMMEKVTEYVRLIEMLINPSSAPPMFVQFVKNMDLDDRKLLQELYEKLIGLELRALEIDVEYLEKSEAETINSIYSVWTSSLEDLRKIIRVMRKSFESSPTKKERNYFG